MFNHRIIFGSIVLIFSGFAHSQDISTYPPGSPLYEAIKESLLQNGSKAVTDEQIIKHINKSTDLSVVNNELVEYFSKGFLESSMDNSQPGNPVLKIYIKNLSSNDIRYVYSNKKYELVRLQNSRFNKKEVDDINRAIGESLTKNEKLLKLTHGGYYDPESDSFVVKIATDEANDFTETLGPVINALKINIKFIKDESDIIELTSKPSEIEQLKQENASGFLKLTSADITGGLPISKSSGPNCTIGFSIIHPNGTGGFITAGHCVNTGDSVRLFDQSSLSYSPVGVTGFSSNGWGNGNDYARVNAEPGANYQPYVTRYGDVNKFNTYYSYAWGRYKKPIRTIVSPIQNAPICKTGFASGETCGTITNPSTWTVTSGDGWNIVQTLYNIIDSNVCSIQGDSGGPGYDLNASAAIGIVSAGRSNGNGVCTTGATVGGKQSRTIFVPIMTALSSLGVNLLTYSGPSTMSENCSSPVCLK
ncbi:S1 family peptidase [Comamonas odontotermitis]|uniref:S1 family peptidase n=1 Tax=Comamonas odontotermitis TaxID=379895 RepID=UPI0036710F62